MNFADYARNISRFTKTENGAVALSTSGSALLDLYGTIGSLRNAEDERIFRLFSNAYKEHPIYATKIVFYARDIICGLGERKTFRTLIRYMAEHYPESLRPNFDLIGVYGRYDDLYSLIGTPLEDDMWIAMKKQFNDDLVNLHKGNAISLLAKWIKTADASSEKTRTLGILTAHKLGYSVYSFKRIIREMRKKIGIVEALMSDNRWDEITYSKVPSRAMMLYRNAFFRHDGTRYKEFIKKAVSGEEKIHSSTLYPYDIIEKCLDNGNDMTIEAQWRQLPNYVGENANVLIMADTSGSMIGRPLNSAIGLAIYFAERNKGAFHNLWMSFSSQPTFHELKGETLAQKIANLDKRDWEMNTNLKAAFDAIIDIAEENDIPSEDMPKSLIVISDMEIDYCGDRNWSFYDKMTHKFEKHGYSIPNVIFWNVNSRSDVFHADSNRKGVQLASGQSITVFKQIMQSAGTTPIEAMMKVLNGDRYKEIRVYNSEKI